MQAAFKAAAEEKMEPSWATARVCLGRKRCDPTEVFVCDPFAGAAFEHLRQIQARVVGPLCVSMAIRTQVALPRQAEPVYSLAFHNLVLTSSALASGERERLKTLVELMGAPWWHRSRPASRTSWLVCPHSAAYGKNMRTVAYCMCGRQEDVAGNRRPWVLHHPWNSGAGR
ncbi:hypothetical protein HPB48_021598 [Haemaphysalis longicornis]|uniref:TopBP1-like BRCT0 domain-containing protein n=1 Tax=Haemaphysalis longicornis TaxID=44386 RepID=A0A9J6FST9_HAELO|nr:hypothetical protein HPB48_021598 [Haemaphysalis longicornis]